MTLDDSVAGMWVAASAQYNYVKNCENWVLFQIKNYI